ncbi:hypothetical protein D3C76_1820870 [compost metagenome]
MLSGSFRKTQDQMLLASRRTSFSVLGKLALHMEGVHVADLKASALRWVSLGPEIESPSEVIP